MAVKNKRGDWIDTNGNVIPASIIDVQIKRREALITGLMKKIRAEQARLEKLKSQVSQQIRKYMESNDHVPKTAHGKQWRGNMTLTNFDQTEQIEVKVSRTMVFDERLNAAKVIIDECLGRWSKDSNDNLRVAITEAFDVDKSGTVDTKMILRLTKWKIRDKKWRRAVELILQSISEQTSVTYYQFRERDDADAGWNAVSLNFSRL